MKYILTLLILTGCASPHKARFYIDPAFATQWVAFVEEADHIDIRAPAIANDLYIHFGNPKAACNNPKSIACCVHNSTPEVIIDKAIWSCMDDTERELVVFHELGHCLLERGHINITEYGIPISIMYYATPDPLMVNHYIGKEHQAYINELFQVGPPPRFEAP